MLLTTEQTAVCCRGETRESNQGKSRRVYFEPSLAQRTERAATPKISTTAA
jgi:hypothetical protein